MSYLAFGVPRTGLEPARLSTLAPETSASTIPPPGPVVRMSVSASACRFVLCGSLALAGLCRYKSCIRHGFGCKVTDFPLPGQILTEIFFRQPLF